MSVNLASKYESQIITKWQIESFLAGKVSNKYSFEGVRSISIYTPVTVDLSDYTRSGTNRFGTPVEMQDTLQTLTLSQDKSFAITIDKGNNADQLNIKGAGEMMSLQMKEKMIPHNDKYALSVWAKHAGNSVVVSAPAKDTIVTMLATALVTLDNEQVPDDMRWIFIGGTNYNLLRLSSEYLASDPLSSQILPKGVVGTFMNATVVKVPDSYMPTGVQFLIAHRDAVIYPMKLKTLRILTDVAGLDGSLLEGRHYFDAFVLGQKANGVYAGVLTANKVAKPVLTNTNNTVTVGAVSGVTFYYTVDGTDPRFSSTASAMTEGVVLASGETIKVVGMASGKCDSDIAEKVYA